MRLPPRASSPLIGLFAFACGPQEKQPQHLLRLSFQAGRSQFYRDTTETTMKGKVVPSSIGMDMTMTMEMTREERVVSVKEGKAQVEQVIHRIVIRTTGPLQIDYDSDDPHSDPGALGSTVEIVGKASSCTFDERGRGSDFVLPESVGAGLPFGGDARSWMSGMGNLAELPEAPVAIGDTWETSAPTPVPGLGEGKTKVVTRLLEVDEGRATLEQDMRMDTESLKMPGGFKMECEATRGVTVIDLATGRTLESTSEMVMKMTGGVSGVGVTTTTHLHSQAIEPPAKKGDAMPAAGEAGK
jgi:hypothetical protein